jgi:hypothetical protein
LKLKRLLAALITLALLVGAFVFSRPKATPDEAPEDCVQRMFAAAERGDVAAYLDCFTGQERRRLERELADPSRDDYGRALQDAMAELKGRAILAPDEESEGSDRVTLTVERVYATRMESQKYHLRRESDQWRIESVEAAQSYQPLQPYGTPVFELPEERQ